MIKDYNRYTFEGKELKEGLLEFLRNDIFDDRGWNMVADTEFRNIIVYPSCVNTFAENEVCFWKNPRVEAVSQFDDYWSVGELEEYATEEEIEKAKSKSIDNYEELDLEIYKDNLFDIIKDKESFLEDLDTWLSFDRFFEIFVDNFNNAFENL